MIHSISSTCKRLYLQSLERRRARGDVTEMYKWLKEIGRVDVDRVLQVHTYDRTRNNGFKLDKFRCRTDKSKNWFEN